METVMPRFDGRLQRGVDQVADAENGDGEPEQVRAALRDVCGRPGVDRLEDEKSLLRAGFLREAQRLRGGGTCRCRGRDRARRGAAPRNSRRSRARAGCAPAIRGNRPGKYSSRAPAGTMTPCASSSVKWKFLKPSARAPASQAGRSFSSTRASQANAWTSGCRASGPLTKSRNCARVTCGLTA